MVIYFLSTYLTLLQECSVTGRLTDMPAGQIPQLAPWLMSPALSTCPGTTKVSHIFSESLS